jgi:hypothetical protein
MANPKNRRTAPAHERTADQRPGTFKSGHEKRGGRRRGTSNAFSADYRKAILEAAFRIGMGGNGEGGIVGYFRFLARYHPRIFMPMLARLLPWEDLQRETSVPQHRTMQELNKLIRVEYGLDEKLTTAPVEPGSSWDWTDEGLPLGPLMQCAVEDPRAFCKLLTAAFLRPPTARDRRARVP